MALWELQDGYCIRCKSEGRPQGHFYYKNDVKQASLMIELQFATKFFPIVIELHFTRDKSGLINISEREKVVHPCSTTLEKFLSHQLPHHAH
jgi:hypothetical protein